MADIDEEDKLKQQRAARKVVIDADFVKEAPKSYGYEDVPEEDVIKPPCSIQLEIAKAMQE